MAQSVRIWQKNRLRLDKLTFSQRNMADIGFTGVQSVKRRVLAALGPTDGPAKPLTKPYAIWKSRKGLRNRRDLLATGQMLDSLKLRTVNDNRAYASVGADARVMHGNKWRTVKVKKKGVWTGAFRNLTNKDVAWANQQRQRWLVFSPLNRRAIAEKARGMLLHFKNSLVISK